MQTYWVLWSIKESSYKAWQRHTKSKPIFNPIHFRVRSQCILSKNNLTSIVQTDGFSFNVDTEFSDEYVYSYCHLPEASHLILPFTQFNSYLKGLKDKGLVLQKSTSNVPHLLELKTQTKRPLSLSHDGRFCAINYV